MVDEAAVVMSTHLISAVEALVQLPSYWSLSFQSSGLILVAQTCLVIRPGVGSTSCQVTPPGDWHISQSVLCWQRQVSGYTT